MKKKTGKLPQILLVVVLVLAIAGSVASYGYSKYKTNVIMTDEVTYRNQLASGFRLLEFETRMNADGSYSRQDGTAETQTNYLIPGATIPQAPFIRIDGKTAVKACLFLEVVEEYPAGVKYSLTDDWTLLDGVTGRSGGKVYLYQNGRKLTDADDPDKTGIRIEILTADGITTETDEPITDVDKKALSFCGYLVQAKEDVEPADLFPGD